MEVQKFAANALFYKNLEIDFTIPLQKLGFKIKDYKNLLLDDHKGLYVIHYRYTGNALTQLPQLHMILGLSGDNEQAQLHINQEDLIITIFYTR